MHTWQKVTGTGLIYETEDGVKKALRRPMGQGRGGQGDHGATKNLGITQEGKVSPEGYFRGKSVKDGFLANGWQPRKEPNAPKKMKKRVLYLPKVLAKSLGERITSKKKNGGDG